jgi:CBS domain-containing protein
MTSTPVDPRALDFDPGRVVAADRASPALGSAPTSPEALTVGAAMTTPPATIDPDAPLLEVVHRLIDCGEEELVVTAGSRPAGVITARRILALLAPDKAQWRPRRALDLVPSRSPRLLPGLSLATAAREMLDDGHDALPVVDSHGDLIGVIGHRHLVEQLTDERRMR